MCSQSYGRGTQNSHQRSTISESKRFAVTHTADTTVHGAAVTYVQLMHEMKQVFRETRGAATISSEARTSYEHDTELTSAESCRPIAVRFIYSRRSHCEHFCAFRFSSCALVEQPIRVKSLSDLLCMLKLSWARLVQTMWDTTTELGPHMLTVQHNRHPSSRCVIALKLQQCYDNFDFIDS